MPISWTCGDALRAMSCLAVAAHLHDILTAVAIADSRPIVMATSRQAMHTERLTSNRFDMIR
jgi:hypothetical protein